MAIELYTSIEDNDFSSIVEHETLPAIEEEIDDISFDYETVLLQHYVSYLIWFAGNQMSEDWYRSTKCKLIKETIFRADINGIMDLDTFNTSFNEVWYEYITKEMEMNEYASVYERTSWRRKSSRSSNIQNIEE